MGSHKLAPYLKEYVAQVPPERAIVEVGAWLGAGTQYLVRPAGPLYVYDRFKATRSEVVKAASFGVDLTLGQDTLPLVRQHLPHDVHFVKGDLRCARYNGPIIGLYVDDASKSLVWGRMMRTFEPHFGKGAILVLMDYHFPTCRAQRRYAKKWEVVHLRIPGISAAVFRC